MWVVLCTLLFSLSAVAGGESKKWFAFETNGKWGYRSESGKVYIPPKFDYADSIYQSHALVRMDGKYGMLGGNRDWLLPCKYDTVKYISYYLVTVRGGKWKIHRPYSKYLSLPDSIYEMQFDSLKPGGFEHIAMKLGNRWGIVGARNFHLPMKYEDVRGVGRNGDLYVYFVPVREGNRWGFADSTGNFKLQPTYEDARSFCGPGWAPVKKGGKWGMVDTAGTWKIKPRWDAIGDYNWPSGWIDYDYSLPVCLNGRWGYVDESDNLIQPCVMDSLLGFDLTKYRDLQVLVPYSSNNLWGFKTADGAVVIPTRFDSVRALPEWDGYLHVWMRGEEWVVDSTGRQTRISLLQPKSEPNGSP